MYYQPHERAAFFRHAPTLLPRHNYWLLPRYCYCKRLQHCRHEYSLLSQRRLHEMAKATMSTLAYLIPLVLLSSIAASREYRKQPMIGALMLFDIY